MKREIGLFFLLLISASDSHDINCTSEQVEAAVGDDVTLDCHLKSKRDVTGELVEWKFNDSFVIIYKNRGLSPDDQAEEFKGRAALDVGELRKGNLAVKISSVNTADGGIYTCSVRDKHKQISCNVHLNVQKSSNKSKAKSPEGTDTTPSLENGNKDWIIGLSVVGSVVIAVLAVVLGFLIWKKCQHQNPAAPGNPVENIPLN
ncbi:myelin-oligodendrocyte glycoprotein-like [Thunnus thynnus]|uniref:myelin-oligodendrocyte glycoprotein-like n=1 Tax=Thunnus thynnus TaxID=8237 RepID=UPI0035285D32